MNAPEAPQFDEQWQAQAFAMTLALHQRGLFTWPEWTEALGVEIAAGGQDAGNAAYYAAWLAALEKLVISKGLGSAGELASLADAWQAAAERTPHGQPIVLDPTSPLPDVPRKP